MKNYEDAVGIDFSIQSLDLNCYLKGKNKVFGNDAPDYRSPLH